VTLPVLEGTDVIDVNQFIAWHQSTTQSSMAVLTVTFDTGIRASRAADGLHKRASY
jgi:hypothetical protein